MNIEYNDGGRVAAGFKGGVADCVTRAIAIAADWSYRVVRDTLRDLNPDGGIDTLNPKFRTLMAALDFTWFDAPPASTIDDLPNGRFVAWVKGHYTAIIDRTIQDTEDATGLDLLGYWVYNPLKLFSVCENGVQITRNSLNADQARTMQRQLLFNYKRKTFIR